MAHSLTTAIGAVRADSVCVEFSEAARLIATVGPNRHAARPRLPAAVPYVHATVTPPE